MIAVRTTALALCLAAIGCGDDAPVAEPPPGAPEPFVAMTFNVLCSFCDPSFDPWDERLGYFADIFARHDPDLIGLQELAFDSEVNQMLAMLPGHAAAYYASTDSNFTYPDATVLYRTERFEERSRGEYWLSPTPDVPSSSGFASPQLPRLVMWIELVDKHTRRSIYFASTHFDNNSPSQELSAPLVLERTQPWSDRMAVVVLGDFNSQPSDAAYLSLTQGLTNAFDLAQSWSVDHNQATEPAYDLDARIDHIFVAPQPDDWTVEHWTVDLYVYGASNRYPSDHWPVVARLQAPPL